VPEVDSAKTLLKLNNYGATWYLSTLPLRVLPPKGDSIIQVTKSRPHID